MTQYAQPTQTAVKVEELRLPGLDGMLPGAEVKGREKTALQYLVEVGNLVVNEYKHETGNPLDPHDFGNQDALYNKIYKRLEEELLNGVDFKQKDMEDYILIKANRDFDDESIILGLYTGCLLHLLTVRNREKGERTVVHLNGEIDGKPNTFDYLFLYAKQVDELVVENFEGIYVCGEVASCGGKADLVALISCGDFGVGAGIAYNGEVDRLVVADCSGDLNSLKTGAYGKIGSAILIGNFGNDHSDGVGQNLAEEGEAGLIMAVGAFDRKPVLPGVGKDGSVDLIIATGANCSEGYNPKNAGLIYLEDIILEYQLISTNQLMPIEALHLGNINTVVASNCKADSVLEDKNNVKYLVSHNNDTCDIFLRSEAEEKMEYERIRKEYGIGSMLKLANTVMRSASTEEILKLTKKIHEIYESVKPKLKELMPEQEEK